MIHGWKNARRLSLTFILSGMVFSGTGCSKSDPETLASIGHKLADRTQLISDNLEQTWSKFSGRVVVESRIKARLHWDKSLADAAIEVHATDKAVELKGTVATQAQAQRAVELAESTVGVEKVVNSLQVDQP